MKIQASISKFELKSPESKISRYCDIYFFFSHPKKKWKIFENNGKYLKLYLTQLKKFNR